MNDFRTTGALRSLPVRQASSFQSVTGHGVMGTVDGRALALDNARLMTMETIALGTVIGNALRLRRAKI